MTGLFKVYAES